MERETFANDKELTLPWSRRVGFIVVSIISIIGPCHMTISLATRLEKTSIEGCIYILTSHPRATSSYINLLFT